MYITYLHLVLLTYIRRKKKKGTLNIQNKQKKKEQQQQQQQQRTKINCVGAGEEERFLILI